MNELTNQTDEQYKIIEKVLINGDISQLNEQQRLDYAHKLCDNLGLNIYTKPFEYIRLKGKLTLYATKNAAEQLRKIHNISIQVTDRTLMDGIYIITVRAQDVSGRYDEATAAIPIPSNMSASDKADLFMKAETKAKRRVTLSICSLGMLDETEVETVKNIEQQESAGFDKMPGAKPLLKNEELELKNRIDKMKDFFAQRGIAMNQVLAKQGLAKLDEVNHAVLDEMCKDAVRLKNGEIDAKYFEV